MINCAISNLKNWTDIWRNVRFQYDFDKNGFVSVDELTDLFFQYYPVQLQGKSMSNYLKEFTSFYDETLLNYKVIKDGINKEVNLRLAEMKANPTGEAARKSEIEKMKETNPLTLGNLSRLQEVRNFDESMA